MTIEELAAVIKKQHPDYAEVDDIDLIGAIIEKYPEYRENLDQADLVSLEAYRRLLKHPTQKEIGKHIEAGMSGTAALIGGEGLQKAASEVERVKEGEKPETTAGKVGEFVGEMVAPEQIALQGPLTSVLAPLGPWAAQVMKGWGEKAALFAAGIVGRVAKALGSKSLPETAQFLLSPVKVGAKEMPAVVTATNSTKNMLDAAEAIRDEAGRALGKIDPVIDAALEKTPQAIDLNGILANLNELQATMVKYHKRAGKAIVTEFQQHIDDLKDVIVSPQSQKTLFSELREFKTTLGELIQNFESDAPVKVAAQKVYGVVADGLEKAAQVADEATGAAFKQANDIYTRILPIIDALEGKVTKGTTIFSDLPSMGVGILAGFANPVAAIPAALGAHAAKAYGPQAVATGLKATAPIVRKALPSAGALVPNAIQAALGE